VFRHGLGPSTRFKIDPAPYPLPRCTSLAIRLDSTLGHAREKEHPKAVHQSRRLQRHRSWCHPPDPGGIALRQLSGELAPLFGGLDRIDVVHPLFASITHLDIFDRTPCTPISHRCPPCPIWPCTEKIPGTWSRCFSL
ncbi:hypothetical protein FB451DRAFT_1365951, partial [Mycena latifolia]